MLDALDSIDFARELNRLVDETYQQFLDDMGPMVADEFRRAARRKVRAKINEKISAA